MQSIQRLGGRGILSSSSRLRVSRLQIQLKRAGDVLSQCLYLQHEYCPVVHVQSELRYAEKLEDTLCLNNIPRGQDASSSSPGSRPGRMVRQGLRNLI